MAFDQKACPAGWTEFTDASGRFLLARGKGVAADHPFRELGGEEAHVLTKAEMPRHSHQERGSNRPDVANGGAIHAHDVDNGSFEKIITSEEGEGQPHNNMPPFIALTVCVKD
jgi:microcystin-dependent protein